MLKARYKTQAVIQTANPPNPVDRTLISDVKVKELSEQIQEMS